eukprot:PhF_6_TR9437/c0_g1_i1/m.14750
MATGRDANALEFMSGLNNKSKQLRSSNASTTSSVASSKITTPAGVPPTPKPIQQQQQQPTARENASSVLSTRSSRSALSSAVTTSGGTTAMENRLIKLEDQLNAERESRRKVQLELDEIKRMIKDAVVSQKRD